MNPDHHRQLQQWIAVVPPNALRTMCVDLVARQADAELVLALRWASGLDLGTPPNVPLLNDLLQRAMRPDHDMTWRDEAVHAQRAEAGAAVLHALADAGYHAVVQAGCEVAIDALEAVFNHCDEAIAQTALYEDLVGLHLRACQSGSPNTRALADWLHRKHRDSVIEGFAAPWRDYLAILERSEATG